MRIGALILIAVLILTQLRMSLIQMDYLLHKDFIAAELCIEKDVEESTCEGKCYMSKRMAEVKASSEDEDSPAPLRVQVEEISFTDVGQERCYECAVIEHFSESGGYLSPRLTEGYPSIDRPPPEFG